MAFGDYVITNSMEQSGAEAWLNLKNAGKEMDMKMLATLKRSYS
jgi:hypothetical protein